MLSPNEITLANQRLTAILREHGLDWVVGEVDDAMNQGVRPSDPRITSRNLSRLVLLIDATERALTMTGELEDAVPELLLRETSGDRVHFESEDREGFGRGDLRRHTVERDRTARRQSEVARERTLELLTQLRSEALESG